MQGFDCPTLPQLDQFLAGELPEEELSKIERHIDVCDACFHQLKVRQKKLAHPLYYAQSFGDKSDLDAHLTDSAEFFLNRLTADSPRVLPQSIDDYRVLRLISSGGNGEVYECRDEKLNRRVALKTIRPQSLSSHSMERFLNEARIQAKLSHENIVQLFGFGQSDSDIPYLVMELLEGGTLSKLIRKGPLTPKKAAVLIEKCARAMAYAHAKGVLHRDLKPSNILLTEKEEKTIPPHANNFT